LAINHFKQTPPQSNSTAVGYQAGYSQTTASGQDWGSTFIGRNAGYAVTGLDNTFVGAFSGASASSSGAKNNGFGTASLYSITSGGYNVAIGSSALYSTTTGTQNVAIGYGALYSNTTASNNTGLGYQAGTSITKVQTMYALAPMLV